MTRNEAMKRIRQGLKDRSGKTWSTKGHHGTGYGYFKVLSPPKRRNQYGEMTYEDRKELGELLGLQDYSAASGEGETPEGTMLPVGPKGKLVAYEERDSYVRRAECGQ
jgi:hypothetical protein